MFPQQRNSVNTWEVGSSRPGLREKMKWLVVVVKAYHISQGTFSIVPNWGQEGSWPFKPYIDQSPDAGCCQQGDMSKAALSSLSHFQRSNTSRAVSHQHPQLLRGWSLAGQVGGTAASTTSGSLSLTFMTCWSLNNPWVSTCLMIFLSEDLRPPLSPGWELVSICTWESEIASLLTAALSSQCAELAFTSSVTSLPSVPGVRGSQPEDFWKVLPLQRHDAPGSCEKDYSKWL